MAVILLLPVVCFTWVRCAAAIRWLQMMVYGGGAFIVGMIFNFMWHVYIPLVGIFLGLASIYTGFAGNHHLAM